MTEEEAKTKQCCSDVSNPCAGSACMAWVWTRQEFHRDRELWSKSKGVRVTSAWSDDADWRPVGPDADKAAPPAIGRCGLVRARQ